jgi:hypothetical protein
MLSRVSVASAQAAVVRGIDEEDEPLLEGEHQEQKEEEADELARDAPRVPDVDADLERLGGYLDSVEKSTKRYFYSWLVLQTGITGAQAYVALTWDDPIIRGSYWIGTALSGTSLLLQLISPRPALRGVGKFRKMPAGTEDEKRQKLEYGESVLAGQVKADLRATGIMQHITGVVAALGSGLGVGLGWDNALKQAVTRSVGVFIVAELQIITRPRTSIELMDRYGRESTSLQVSLLPMLERDAQGLMLAGTF